MPKNAVVVEQPTIHDDPVERGTFVVISVDPLASVSLLDEQAKREAALIKPTKCLALVEGHANFEWSDANGAFRLSLMFLLAGSHLPVPPTPWAAVPIAPTPAHPHTGRRPIQTKAPVRWPRCYVHTTSSVSGVISRYHPSPHATPGPALAPDAYRALARLVIEDGMQACDEENDRIAAATFRGLDDSDEDDDDELEFDFGMGMNVPPRDDEDDEEDDLEDLIGRDNVLRMRLSFEMWVDASSLDKLGDPEDVYVAIEQLRRIERDWARRVAAAQLVDTPATLAWLNDVAHSEIPPVEDSRSSEECPDYDTLVKPEDAVDYRIEKERLLRKLTRPVNLGDHRAGKSDRKRKRPSTRDTASSSESLPATAIAAGAARPLRIDYPGDRRPAHRRMRSSGSSDSEPHLLSRSVPNPCSQQYLSSSPSKLRAWLDSMV